MSSFGCQSCVDCRDLNATCLACSLGEFLNDSSPATVAESIGSDDVSGLPMPSFMAPADNVVPAEAAFQRSEQVPITTETPVDATDEMPLADLVDAFFNNYEDSSLEGARHKGPPSPSTPERKSASPERDTPGSKKRKRASSTRVPANNGERGQKLIELALEAAEAGNSIAESAYLFRASGQSDGANRAGNVYKYARYIGEIIDNGTSRDELLSSEAEDVDKIEYIVRKVCKRHASLKVAAKDIYYNYNRAVCLYRTLAVSFSTYNA